MENRLHNGCGVNHEIYCACSQHIFGNSSVGKHEIDRCSRRGSFFTATCSILAEQAIAFAELIELARHYYTIVAAWSDKRVCMFGTPSFRDRESFRHTLEMEMPRLLMAEP